MVIIKQKYQKGFIHRKLTRNGSNVHNFLPVIGIMKGMDALGDTCIIGETFRQDQHGKFLLAFSTIRLHGQFLKIGLATCTKKLFFSTLNTCTKKKVSTVSEKKDPSTCIPL